MKAIRRIENIRNILNNSFGNAELKNEIISNLLEIESQLEEANQYKKIKSFLEKLANESYGLDDVHFLAKSMLDNPDFDDSEYLTKTKDES